MLERSINVGAGAVLLTLVSALFTPGCEPALRIRPTGAPRLRLPENVGIHNTVPESHRLGLITYNAGLARSVIPDAELRSRALPDELRSVEANVLCLQEVWDETDASRLASALEARFPHQVRPGARAVPRGGCTEAESRPAFTCVKKHCVDRKGPELVRCALNSCAASAEHLSKTCRGCLMNTEPTTLEAVRRACVGERSKSSATWQGPVWALNGAYGLALYSDIPLQDVRIVQLESSVHPRGVISATLKTQPPARVLCTHLTPRLRSAHPAGGSYIDENLRQVQGVLKEAGRPGPDLRVVMGDLNTGPQTDAADARLPEHYSRFASAGFINPFLEQDGRCTYCYDNPLTGGNGERGVVLDHILLDGAPGAVYARRRFDLVLPLGNGQRMALSDHYGIEVLLDGVQR